jgi:hypothetical protein
MGDGCRAYESRVSVSSHANDLPSDFHVLKSEPMVLKFSYS